MEFNVNITIEDITGQNANKGLRATLFRLIGPVSGVISWLVAVVIIAPASYTAISNLLSHDMEFLLANVDITAKVIGLSLAGWALIVFFGLFNLDLVRNTKGSGKTTQAPNENDFPNIIKGLHFGPGTVTISEEGVTLTRALYSGFYAWQGITGPIESDYWIGVNLADGDTLRMGTSDNPDFIQMFKQTVEDMRQFA